MNEESKVVKVVKTNQSSFVRSRLQAGNPERAAYEEQTPSTPEDEDTDAALMLSGTTPMPRSAVATQSAPIRFRRASAPPGGEVVQHPQQTQRTSSSLEKEAESRNQDTTKVVKVVKVVERLEDFPVVEETSDEGVPKLYTGPTDEMLRLVRDRLRARHEASAHAKGLVPGEGSQPSRSEGKMVSRAAMEQYLRRGETLFNRWRLETGSAPESEEDADPVAFVNWLLSRKPSLKASSWKLYRLSAIHWLDGFPSRETGRALGLLETDTVEGSMPGKVRERWEESRKQGQSLPSAGSSEAGDGDDDDEEENSERRTSALKEKRFPEEMLERVRMRLKLGTRSRLAEAVTDWLEAGILTALRPGEWGAVDLVVREVPRTREHPYGRMALLYVINAKATNGRGTGVSRTMDLSNFNDESLSVVRRHSARCRDWLERDVFAKMKAQCSALLKTTVRALWPAADGGGIEDGRHYALYSCRHQAIANWKSLRMPLEELAALVGHASTATATERYGKRRSGWRRPSIPQPPRGVPEEVALVRIRINMFQDRKKMEKDLGITSTGPAEFTI